MTIHIKIWFEKVECSHCEVKAPCLYYLLCKQVASSVGIRKGFPSNFDLFIIDL